MPGSLCTGQADCYESNGKVISCIDSGQDGELQTGIPWQQKRFAVDAGLVLLINNQFFEPDWAWALYLNKGTTGVGFKQGRGFHLWPVASAL